MQVQFCMHLYMYMHMHGCIHLHAYVHALLFITIRQMCTYRLIESCIYVDNYTCFLWTAQDSHQPLHLGGGLCRILLRVALTSVPLICLHSTSGDVIGNLPTPPGCFASNQISAYGKSGRNWQEHASIAATFARCHCRSDFHRTIVHCLYFFKLSLYNFQTPAWKSWWAGNDELQGLARPAGSAASESKRGWAIKMTHFIPRTSAQHDWYECQSNTSRKALLGWCADTKFGRH